jgi:hypothetical protein
MRNIDGGVRAGPYIARLSKPQSQSMQNQEGGTDGQRIEKSSHEKPGQPPPQGTPAEQGHLVWTGKDNDRSAPRCEAGDQDFVRDSSVRMGFLQREDKGFSIRVSHPPYPSPQSAPMHVFARDRSDIAVRVLTPDVLF